MISEETLEAMSIFGNSFANKLADLYGVADDHSAKILEKEFSVIFKKYEEFSENFRKYKEERNNAN